MVFTLAKVQPGQPEFTHLVGRVCAAWSYFELITDRLLWGTLGISEDVGARISAQKDLRGRWKLLLKNATDKESAGELDLLRRIEAALKEVAAQRNIVVHGQILRKDDLWFAIINRGDDAGRFHRMTVEAMKTIIANIATLAEWAKEVANPHGWLEEQPEGEIQTDWPKKLEGFQAPPSLVGIAFD